MGSKRKKKSHVHGGNRKTHNAASITGLNRKERNLLREQKLIHLRFKKDKTKSECPRRELV